MYWVKKHTDSGGRLLIAACDKDVLGNQYVEGDLVLEVPRTYFAAEEVNGDELVDLSNRAGILHFVGSDVTTFAKENKLIDAENVRIVDGVPYAMTVKIADQ